MNESSDSAPPLEPLNERELQILRLIADGLSNQQIAQNLFLSLNTVKWYNQRIFEKLGVGSRMQATAQARALGWLDGPAADAAEADDHDNLPAQDTRFVGRKQEIAQIEALLAGARLVTLTGPGGIGKTRLALAVAARQIEAFADGVFLVSLAPLNATQDIVQAIIEALGQSFLASGDLKAHLFRYLHRKEMLLVPDNFDHLLDGASLMSEILAHAPGVRILATSREKLRLHSETVFLMSGLSYPDSSDAPTADIADYGSVRLFLARARQAQPDFSPDTADLSQIVRICQMVQGMPLAVELAAAWINTLSCDQIADEIDRSLGFLAAELRDMPPRQRSIRAVFDQSWNLTPTADREVFLRLSVFRGGFTREAAEAVAGGTLPILASLVDKSLLRWNLEDQRYQIHELLRQYALDRLARQPAERQAAEEAHAAYFAHFMESCEVHLRDQQQVATLAAISADLENIRAAWRHWLHQRNAAQMGRFMDGFAVIYWVRGWLHAGEEVSRAAVDALLPAAAQGEIVETVLAVSLGLQARFLAHLGRSEQAHALITDSVKRLDRLHRPLELARVLDWAILVAYHRVRPAEEEAAVRRMIELAEELGDPWLIAFSRRQLGMIALKQGDYIEARRITEESLAVLESFGDLINSTFLLANLGHICAAVGEYEQASAYYARMLVIGKQLDFRWAIVNASKYLGQLALAQGDAAVAGKHMHQSLRIAEEVGLTRETANLLVDFARLRIAEDRREEAVELLVLAIQHPASHQGRLEGRSTRDQARALLTTLETQLSPEAYDAAYQRGSTRELDEAIAAILRALKND